MGILRCCSRLLAAGVAASWLQAAAAWKTSRIDDLAVNVEVDSFSSFLDTQWGDKYAHIPGEKNADGTISFIFANAVGGFVEGHEPEGEAGGLGTPEGPPSTEVPEISGGTGGVEEPEGGGEAGGPEEPGNAGAVGGTVPEGGEVPPDQGEPFDEGNCRLNDISATGPAEFRVLTNVNTLEKCHDICLEAAACNWYTYNSVDKKCYLKKHLGPMKRVKAGDITSPKFCDSSCYEKNKKIIGTPLETSADNASAFLCHYKCYINPDCQLWSWEAKTRQCDLFAQVELEKKSLHGYFSGSRHGCGKEAEYEAGI